MSIVFMDYPDILKPEDSVYNPKKKARMDKTFRLLSEIAQKYNVTFVTARGKKITWEKGK